MRTRSRQPLELVVFSDDWGRHPSSCQHLARALIRRHGDALDVTWVNTIGTRAIRLNWSDAKRAFAKARSFASPTPGFAEPSAERSATHAPRPSRVLSPAMWPGFRNAAQRRANAWAMSRVVRRTLGPRRADVPRAVLTTLPITADLPGRLDADRWVYLAVDDFSVWPGLDGDAMDAMERDLVARVDAVLAVSDTLRRRLATMGRDASLLTHGIDLAHWRSRPGGPTAAETAEPIPTPAWLVGRPRPWFVFWGLIDARLDAAWCRALIEQAGGTLALVGPSDGGVPRLLQHANVVAPGPAAYDDLPGIAGHADALVMPYVDAPVTRAMQPLKLKEYLATGRPAVVRRLPATTPWADACDAVADAASFVTIARRRAAEGLPATHRDARRRLDAETWDAKARGLWAAILGEPASAHDFYTCPPANAPTRRAA